ncbi:helix-turn-helix transcriptional regulator [Amycolatopsis jejuensis]|uniref:helix-turn-helix transcriptional regulator n=1 Tax=Amycolatopsis jejuensis TaxID=330084 RepID=UPI0009FFC76F|nr:LuxR C-terminal-related transcriptional regulator [Amycolatopsis jejuensis]
MTGPADSVRLPPGRAVLVRGPGGSGRTTLAQRLADARPGPVLRAAAAEWEGAYAVVRQLVPDLPVDGSPLMVADALAARLAPGTLLVVDDAHLADVDSIRTLSSLLRHHPQVTVLLTAATGDPRARADVLELLTRMADDEVRVPPLDAAEVSELASAHGIALHPTMAERLCRHTLGRPRFVVQLLTEVPRTTWARFDPNLPAPAAIAASVRERLAAISPAAERFVAATAVLGAGAAVRSVAALADVDDPLPVLDEACATRLVELAPRGLSEVGPPDPMVRAAVLAELGPERRSQLQRRAADLVEDSARSLRLLVAASPVPDASVADRLDAMAVERAAEGAWGTAAVLLNDAGRLTEEPLLRQERITRAVDALIGAGDVFRAAALAPEVESVRETPLRDAVLGYLAVVRGRATEAGSRLSRAWDIVNASRDPETAAVICQRYVLDALCRYNADDLVRWADRAIELAVPETPPAIEAAAIRGLGLAASGRARQARRDYTHLAERIRHGAQAQRVVMARGWLNLLTDRIDDARVDLESAVPTSYLGGSARISLWAQAWLARTLFLTGEWDDALRVVREARGLIDRSGIMVTGPLLYWTAAAIHTLRGDRERADEALLACAAGPQDYEIMRVPGLLARAQVAEAAADSSGVLRALHPLTRSSLPRAIDEPGHWPWQDLYAHALVLSGRSDEADAFLVPHERLAAKRDHVSTRARLAAARGRLLGARNDHPGATAAFDEAMELIGTLPLRYDQARMAFAYGQTLRRLGRRARADTQLAAARDGFASMGATTYAARCDRELRAGGVHVPRSGADKTLTPQEEAVARLVARGQSNREVAAELFLSVKTVQYHLEVLTE